MKRLFLSLAMLVLLSLSVHAVFNYERELTLTNPGGFTVQDGNTFVCADIAFGRALASDAMQVFEADKTTAIDFNVSNNPGFSGSATGDYNVCWTLTGNIAAAGTATYWVQYDGDVATENDTDVVPYGMNDAYYAYYRMEETNPKDWAWGKDATASVGTVMSTVCPEGRCVAYGAGDKTTFPFTGAQLGDGTLGFTFKMTNNATQRIIGTGQTATSYAGCYLGGASDLTCTSNTGVNTISWAIPDNIGDVYRIYYSWGAGGQHLWGAVNDGQLLLRDSDATVATASYTGAWEICQFGSYAGLTCVTEAKVDEVVFWDNQITSITDLPGFIHDSDAEQVTVAIGAEQAIGAGPTIIVALSPNPAILYPDRGINSISVDLNSTIIPSVGGTISDSNWFVNGVFLTSDVNTTLVFTTRFLDINVTKFAADENGLTQVDSNLNIREAPFDLNTIWSPSIPGKNENVDFNSFADSNAVLLAFMLEELGDVNVMDANQVRAFSSSGIKNMRLHVQNQDTNEHLDFVMEVAGAFRACILDENFNTPIITASVKANGVSQSLDENACFTYSLGALSPASNSTITFTADANIGTTHEYSKRYYSWDLNMLSDFDLNFLLVDNNGNMISFQFYDTDEASLISSQYIHVFYSDCNQVAGRAKTNASGYVDFYLNPNDAGTIFRIEKSTGVVWYYTTVVSCLIPKDELDSSTTITPFDITVGGLGYQDYNGLVGLQSFPILSNTQSFYSATIDDPDGDYYSRTYTFHTKGDTNIYTLQPYLVDVNDGVVGTITTQDQFTTETLPNILVVLLKNIPGVGQSIVESVESDGTGTAILSYILGDSTGYTIRFYNQFGHLLDERFIRPALTAYTANIQQDETVYTTPTFGTVLIPDIGIYPTSGFIKFPKNGINGFDVNVLGGGASTVVVIVSQGSSIIDRNSFTGPMRTHFDYNITTLNTNRFLTVKVLVETLDGNYSAKRSYMVDTDGFDIAAYTKQLVSGTGELGPGAGAWLSIIIILAAISSVGVGFAFGGAAGIGFFVMIAAGFGVLLGFLPLSIFAVMAMGMFGAYLLTRGGG